MKKLIIAAALAVLPIVSQATTFSEKKQLQYIQEHQNAVASYAAKNNKPIPEIFSRLCNRRRVHVLELFLSRKIARSHGLVVIEMRQLYSIEGVRDFIHRVQAHRLMFRGG